jgi:hypothetical protein
MMRLESGEALHLVVLGPAAGRDRRIPLEGGYVVVGREPTCDVQLDDPHVSRTHAALQQRGHAVYVEDLGSSGGTFVNGVAADAAREVHVGDILTFATVRAKLEAGAGASVETRTVHAVRPESAAGGVHIGRQNGEMIGIGEGDVYMSYVKHVTEQRENFLREVAATKTKARWLAWTGFLTFVAGFGLFAFADLSFIQQISNSIQNGDSAPPSVSPFGREVGGVPIGLIGWALGAVGLILLIVGIVLHIVATSRRRQAYREFPVPVPGAVPGAVRRMT